MAEAFFIKSPSGVLTPASDADKAEIDKLRSGQAVRVKFTRVRNLKFHRKWFALARFAYDYWEPTVKVKEARRALAFEAERNFDRFRKDLIILAGYYEAFYRIDGTVRVEAKSIAFENMSEEEFEKLFSATIDVVLKHICPQYTEEQMRNEIVDMTMAFAT